MKILKGEFKLLKTDEFYLDMDLPIYYLESIIQGFYSRLES